MKESYLSERYEKTPRDYQVDNLECHRKAFRSGLKRFITNASVGAGKTLMIAELCRAIMLKWSRRNDNHYAILCLARQGELIIQNAECARGQGVKNSIWSASLNVKSRYFPVIFSTEKSFYNELFGEFKDISFDFLLIDECHQVPIEDEKTNYMEVIVELLKRNPKMIVSGFTGSPYRGINGIVAEFWQKQIQDISTEVLIERGYLVPPVFGFPSDDLHKYDYSAAVSCEKVSRDGERYFEIDEHKASKISSENATLTHEIMLEVDSIVRNRKGGCLVFCSSKDHIKQASEILPPDSYGVIIDGTPFKERESILSAAREGKIKYVFNLSCLTTGVDVPRWDTVVYLRPIGTITLLIQSLGRGLRLCEEINKENALILDYAGVMERLGHIYTTDFIAEALRKKIDKEHDVTACFKCNAENSIFARKCHSCGEWFVTPKLCQCGCKNDPSAKNCVECGESIIDWNQALYRKSYSDGELVDVKGMDVIADGNKFSIQYHVDADEQPPLETYYPWSSNDFCRKMFLVFLRNSGLDFRMSNKYAKMNADTMVKMKAMLSTPVKIAWRISPKTKRPIFKKIFQSGRIENEGE